MHKTATPLPGFVLAAKLTVKLSAAEMQLALDLAKILPHGWKPLNVQGVLRIALARLGQSLIQPKTAVEKSSRPSPPAPQTSSRPKAGVRKSRSPRARSKAKSLR